MDEILKKKIKNSGNNLHLKTVDLLKALNWTVELSPYYYDDITNKPREIDIIANQKFDLVEYQGMLRQLDVFIFIECKHLLGEVAFRLQESDKNKAFSAIITDSISEGVVNKFSNNHHYSRVGKIAKLYDFTTKQDFIFDAMTQSVKSLISFRKRRGSLPPTVYFPMVIFEGIEGFYIINNVKDLDNLDKIGKEENIIFSLNYEGKEFYVDFVKFDNLEKYLQLIDNCINKAGTELKIFYQEENNRNFKTSY